ncbi:MAG: hypothetical protein Tsb0015_06140 [Simkaniaceae bacterium]
MKEHVFLFEPGTWLGEGKIKLTMSEEKLQFYTKWTIPKIDPSGCLECVQDIEISGLSDPMRNEFAITEIGEEGFVIELENQSLGKIFGKGMIKKNVISWEFRNAELGFEGFEFYEKQADGTYFMHAEYATTDDFRTVIQGKIWKQKDES